MSLSWGTQYPKLKTNLRLAVNRLKLLEKKKTEQALKARTEIADFIVAHKEDRARIRVEHIIREDFMVEAFELIEMYCDLLLARFGLIEQMKALEDGIAEAVASLLWAAPRIANDVAEFRVIADQLAAKYGKPFAEAARMNQLEAPAQVAPKLIEKLCPKPPKKLLVEKYMIEIARSAGISFTPDPDVMRDDEVTQAEKMLADYKNRGGDVIGWLTDSAPYNNGGGANQPPPPPPPAGGSGAGGSGFGGGGGGFGGGVGGGGFGGGGGNHIYDVPAAAGAPVVSAPAPNALPAPHQAPVLPRIGANGQPIYPEVIAPSPPTHPAVGPLRAPVYPQAQDATKTVPTAGWMQTPSAPPPSMPPQFNENDFRLPDVPVGPPLHDGTKPPGAQPPDSNADGGPPPEVDVDELMRRFDALKKRK